MTDDQLNEYMAVHVGGWKIDEPPIGMGKRWERKDRHIFMDDEKPDYLHDWNLMREVMERLEACGWGVNITVCPDGIAVSMCRLELKDGSADTLEVDLLPRIEMLPRAVCEQYHEAREKGWL